MNNILFTAIVTPFKKNLSVDFDILKSLLRTQEDAGNGVALLGTTGEGLALSLSEKKEVISFASQLNLAVPLLVGLPGMHMPSVHELIDFCQTEAVSISGYLVPAPLYAKPGVQGQLQWFKSILDRAEFGCMLYNVPSRAGVSIPFELVEQLASNPRFWALKEASGCLQTFQEYRQASKDFLLYSGDDAFIAEQVACGADGLVSVASNIWPELSNHYVRKLLQGENDGKLSSLWRKASQALFLASNPVPAKSIMSALGMIENDFVRPPLSRDDFNDLDMLKDLHKELTNYMS